MKCPKDDTQIEVPDDTIIVVCPVCNTPYEVNNEE